MKPRGKVLFVVIDQLRADVLDGALAPYVPTPNLDRFAAGATVFRNHFTVTAPCGPARASLLTGLYAHHHCTVRNGAPLAARHSNIALEARKSGYEPLLFGYTDSQPDPALRHASDPDNFVYENVMPGFREITEMRLEAGAEWPADLRAKGYDVPDAFTPEVAAIYRPQGGIFGAPALYAAEDSDTANLTSEAIKALDIRRSTDWFAHVTYIRPHPPLVAPAPYHKLIDPAYLPKPCGRAPRHSFLDAWFSEPTQSGLYWGFDGDCAGMDPKTAQHLRAIYLGLVAEVDDHVGRLLGWLERSGQADDTLVVITADHGEMLGDKRMWGKQSVFSPIFHVPLMIRDPRQKGGREVDHFTGSVDVTPTILDWLGGDLPASMDGRSLMSFLGGTPPPDWRGAAFMEIEFGDPGAPTRFEQAWSLPPERCRAAILRDARWSFVHFSGGIPPMLFDRREDPRETTDLAGEPGCRDEVLACQSVMLERLSGGKQAS